MKRITHDHTYTSIYNAGVHCEKYAKSENPFCGNCKESDCLVSHDGTCEMIRKYLAVLGEA